MCVFSVLCSCASNPPKQNLSGLSPQDIKAAVERKSTVTTPTIAKGMKAFSKGDYSAASRHFSHALKFDPRNASLHFLNALCYHMLAELGDTSQIEMAEIGYGMSIEFDPSNPWPLRFLGSLRMSQQKYPEARDLYARALQIDKDNPDLLLALARAAYYAQDLTTAGAAITQAEKLSPENPQILGAAAMIHAATGDFAQSEKALQQLSHLPKPEDARVQYLNSRVEDWRSVHKSAARFANYSDDDNHVESKDIKLAQADGQSASPSPAPASEAAKAPRMVTIDVVLIRSDEVIQTNKGVNLLRGLQLQFSGSSVKTNTKTDVLGTDTTSTPVNTASRTLTSSISIPAVNYNLNIFNDNDAHHEVMARPTLISMDGRPSTFFSGATLNVAIDGNSGSSGSVQAIPIGVNLSVTPQFIDDETIKLEVAAGREFVEEPNHNASFTKFVQTSKNTVNVNVAMKFEETLIVSGMSERATSMIRDGVPLLKDIPVIQYLFSNESTLDYNRSVLVLMTPHRPRTLAKSSSAKGSESPEIKKLMKRVDWFSPASTTDYVLASLGSKDYYTEFRSGDIESSAWNSQASLKSSILRALSFLYY